MLEFLPSFVIFVSGSIWDRGVKEEALEHLEKWDVYLPESPPTSVNMDLWRLKWLGPRGGWRAPKCWKPQKLGQGNDATLIYSKSLGDDDDIIVFLEWFLASQVLQVSTLILHWTLMDLKKWFLFVGSPSLSFMIISVSKCKSWKKITI